MLPPISLFHTPFWMTPPVNLALGMALSPLMVEAYATGQTSEPSHSGGEAS